MVGDAAKRAYDNVRGLATFSSYEDRMSRPYVALRMLDGSYDGTMYETKRDAVRHQLHEQTCAYFSFRNAPNGFSSAKDAAIFLAWHRAAYDAGFRLPDPDDTHGGPDLDMPMTGEHLHNQLRRLIGARRG